MHSSVPLSAALLLLSFGLGASAHGFPIKLAVDGTDYPGANGASASGDSPFRKVRHFSRFRPLMLRNQQNLTVSFFFLQVQSGDPVTDPTSNSIICGTNAQTASNSASVNPGSELQFFWGAESGGGNWFHNVG